jgi:hypothetical protein
MTRAQGVCTRVGCWALEVLPDVQHRHFYEPDHPGVDMVEAVEGDLSVPEKNTDPPNRQV